MAWLVDPEKYQESPQLEWIENSGLDLILVGGSSGNAEALDFTIRSLKALSGKIPICIFPGSKDQVSEHADGILFLSLISGTNPEYLITQQVEGARAIEHLGLEILPTGYLLVNEGEILSVHKASNTLPLLNSEEDRIRLIALAGKYLGLKYFYLEAGSGAKAPVSNSVIQTVKKTVKSPLIVGGGLDSLEKVKKAFDAGADLVVLGNAIEKDPGFLAEVLKAKRWYNQLLNIN
ncbi:MAG: phosphoglycerol geranylgeranyltransferase [Algoriphagus sp.]|nr:phosphoglycerol geranylgeranyltransferase [Algoriphagus sp.]